MIVSSFPCGCALLSNQSGIFLHILLLESLDLINNTASVFHNWILDKLFLLKKHYQKRKKKQKTSCDLMASLYSYKKWYTYPLFIYLLLNNVCTLPAISFPCTCMAILWWGSISDAHLLWLLVSMGFSQGMQDVQLDCHSRLHKQSCERQIVGLWLNWAACCQDQRLALIALLSVFQHCKDLLDNVGFF